MLLGTMLSLMPLRASGQSCTFVGASSCEVNVTLSAGIVPYAAQLTTSTSVTSVGTITQSMLPAGSASSSTSTAGPTITAVANAAYAVTITAQSSTWSYTGPFTDPAKSVGDLSFRQGSTGVFTTMTTTGTSILSGSASVSTTTSLQFLTTWAWASAKPGSYSLPLTITLTTP